MRKEEEEEEKQVNKMLIEDSGLGCENEDKEQGEQIAVKRRRIEEVDCSNAGKSMISSSTASSPSLKIETARDENNNGSSSKSRPVPRRMETGNLSKVPPELFCHILKFLSSEVLVLFVFNYLLLQYFCFILFYT